MTAPTALRGPTPPSDDRLDTRERLLQAAMRLFAERGVDGISIKTISDEAGNRNKSAVGYHFENKQGLIDAVLRRLEQDLGPETEKVLSGFEAALDGGARLTLDEAVLGFLAPVLKLYAAKPYGPDALRVLARLMHDPLDSVPSDLRRLSAAMIGRAVALLRRLMPEKPAYLIQHHVHHAVMATVNGLALQERFISEESGLWTSQSLDAIFCSYAGYVAAGLSAMPLTLPPARPAPWRAVGNRDDPSLQRGADAP